MEVLYGHQFLQHKIATFFYMSRASARIVSASSWGLARDVFARLKPRSPFLAPRRLGQHDRDVLLRDCGNRAFPPAIRYCRA